MTEAARKPSSSVPPRRRLRRLVVMTLVLGGLAAGGWWGWKKWNASRTKEVEYIYATVQRADFQDLVSATGSLQPRDYVDVGAQVSGQLRKLYVEVGNDVTEGQLLAEIDAEQSAARVDASRASLRAQQAQLGQNQINLQKAERDLQRLQNLYKDEATTLELVQNAETTVATTRAQINTQKAQIEQTQASMRVEESNLKYTKIYAPMAGTVVSVTAKQGQTLNTNQAAPTILRIADQSTMTVQTQVSEADVSKLRLNMPVYFTTLGSQGRRWYGQLRKIEPTPTVTNNVVLYNALFDVDNHNRNLMAQMTAQVFFVAAEARDALVLPMSAITIKRPAQGTGQGRRERAGAEAPMATASAASPAASGTTNVAAAAPASRPERTTSNDAVTADATPPRGERRQPRAGDEGGAPRNAAEPRGTEARGGEHRAQAPGEGRSGPPRGDGARSDGPRSEGGWQQNRDGGEQRRPRASDETGAPRTAESRSGAPRGDGSASPATQRAAGSEQRQRPAGQRFGGAPVPGAPRAATVKVAAEDGTITEREVTIGVSSRVQAQILSGLEEGERVVAGTKQPENQRRGSGNNPQQQQQQPGGFGPPGMGPGGTGAGPAGGARR